MIRDNIDPRYNVLYFGDIIDFRIIPKNCSTTAKILWSELNDLPCNDRRDEGNPHGMIPNNRATLSYRKRAVLENNGSVFRGGKIKVAVKRDPIDRWLSAINFCIITAQSRQTGRDYQQFNNLVWVDWDINMIAAYQMGHGYMVNELLPQSYCAGGIDKYDYVYTPETFDDFFLLLERKFNRRFTRVVSTQTKGKGRWSRKDLNDDTIKILEFMYENDYAMGWHL